MTQGTWSPFLYFLPFMESAPCSFMVWSGTPVPVSLILIYTLIYRRIEAMGQRFFYGLQSPVVDLTEGWQDTREAVGIRFCQNR